MIGRDFGKNRSGFIAEVLDAGGSDRCRAEIWGAAWSVGDEAKPERDFRSLRAWSAKPR
jgi:hypothetical protein